MLVVAALECITSVQQTKAGIELCFGARIMATLLQENEQIYGELQVVDIFVLFLLLLL